MSYQTNGITNDVTEGVSKAWLELKSSFDRASEHLH